MSGAFLPRESDFHDELLDIVSLAREDLVAVERRLELQNDIAKVQKQKNQSSPAR